MKPKQPYTMAQLRELAARAGAMLDLLPNSTQYRVQHLQSNANFILDNRREVWRILNELLPQPTTPPPNLKVVVMTEDNRVIDEFAQVRLQHGSLEEMQRYNATLVKWIMRTAAAGEQMHADGTIERMPKLKNPPKGVWELRKELYQMTHRPFCKEDLPSVWARVEELLRMVEGKQ